MERPSAVVFLRLRVHDDRTAGERRAATCDALDAADHRIKLEDAYRFIKGEISSLDEKMRIADLDIQKVYEDIYSKTT